MRRIVFRDAEHQKGCITEQLEVYYDGSGEDAVETYIDRVENTYASEADEFPTNDVYNRLVIELPEEAPIVEVKRTENPELCPPP